jgi:hypothetical protein
MRMQPPSVVQFSAVAGAVTGPLNSALSGEARGGTASHNEGGPSGDDGGLAPLRPSINA